MVFTRFAITAINTDSTILPVNNHATKYVTNKAITRQINDLTNERVRVSFNFFHLHPNYIEIFVIQLLE